MIFLCFIRESHNQILLWYRGGTWLDPFLLFHLVPSLPSPPSCLYPTKINQPVKDLMNSDCQDFPQQSPLQSKLKGNAKIWLVLFLIWGVLISRVWYSSKRPNYWFNLSWDSKFKSNWLKHWICFKKMLY